MSPSIRNRLLFTLLPVILLVWGSIVVIIYAGTRHEVEELIDAQLAQSARILLNVLSHEFYEEDSFRQKINDHPLSIAQQLGMDTHKYEQQLAFQMWLPPHRLALRSQSAPEQPLTNLANGFSDSVIGERRWRVYALTSELDGMQVQVAESMEIRDHLRNVIVMRILIPMLLSLPIMGGLIWFGVGRAMRPLHKIAGDVEHRHLDHLSPIREQNVPLEAQPLINALNALFLRLQQAFENERRFTADAAHELRTPLAALKTQAQVALRATDEEARGDALQQVIAGVDRATHMVQQLLTLARLDPRRDIVSREQMDLQEVISGVLADLAPSALTKNIELSLEVSGSCSVRGDKGMLAILVRNLVDNAIKYTPAGGWVEVHLSREGQQVQLMVVDSGSGIPHEARERVFERFYRNLGNDSPGTGLGLSIVKRIAELHQADISLEDAPQGGLQVKICFHCLGG